MLNRGLLTLVLCVIFVVCFPVSRSFSEEAPSAQSLSISIDKTALASFLGTLPPDEVDEQVRDWAVYGLLQALALPTQKDLPLRDPSQGGSQPGEVSLGRAFPLSDKEWGVLVPRESLKNKALLGGLVDRRYAKTNVLPEIVTFFSYSVSDPSIQVTQERSVPARELFTPAYGYYESAIGSPDDFTTFLQKIDDVVMVQWRQKKLVLGGRKYQKGSQRSLAVEDVAALYRAYALREAGLTEEDYESFVRQEYDNWIQSSKELRTGVESGRIKKDQVLEEIRKKTPYSVWSYLNRYVGFSLEPETAYSELADELDRFTEKTFGPAPAKQTPPTDDKSLARIRFVGTADQLRYHRNMESFLALRSQFRASGSPQGMQMNYFLENMAARHSFQVARYYGKLQGTSSGMILFYTDLLAKLWALNHNQLAPKGTIKGFRTLQEITIPKRYWDNFQKYSYTHLWFGLQEENFDIYGDKLLLQPIATRIYSASRDPLAPGQESPPNYQSREYIGWLDRHFEAIAEYEPYYHKLNQLQKWSCIFLVLAEKDDHTLEFLQRVPVRLDLDFDAWRAQEPRAKARAPITLLDKRQHGQSSECLPTLNSATFQVMGEDIALSGGVSLAMPENVKKKLGGKTLPGMGMGMGKMHKSSPAPARNDPPQPGAAKDGEGPSTGLPAARSASDQAPPSAAKKTVTITLTPPKRAAGSGSPATEGKPQVPGGADAKTPKPQPQDKVRTRAVDEDR